jgi:hypothetical protein
MLGSKQPLGQYMMGMKKPLGSILGTKKPMSNLPKQDTNIKQMNEQKKISGLERAIRKEGSMTLGQFA